MYLPVFIKEHTPYIRHHHQLHNWYFWFVILTKWCCKVGIILLLIFHMSYRTCNPDTCTFVKDWHWCDLVCKPKIVRYTSMSDSGTLTLYQTTKFYTCPNWKHLQTTKKMWLKNWNLFWKGYKTLWKKEKMLHFLLFPQCFQKAS